jgi:hypothetical protein
MDMEQASEYKYQTLIDILAEMVTSYITKHSNLQKGELESANKNDK